MRSVILAIYQGDEADTSPFYRFQQCLTNSEFHCDGNNNETEESNYSPKRRCTLCFLCLSCVRLFVSSKVLMHSEFSDNEHFADITIVIFLHSIRTPLNFLLVSNSPPQLQQHPSTQHIQHQRTNTTYNHSLSKISHPTPTFPQQRCDDQPPQ